MVRFLSHAQTHPAWLNSLLAHLRRHKALLMLAAGLALQLSAIHWCVSRPLGRRLAGMESQLVEQEARLGRLAAANGSVLQANDLLSALDAQGQTLRSAQQALADIRKLRLALEEEARRTARTSEQLARLDALQQQVQTAGQRAADAAEVLDRISQLTSRIEALSDPASAGLAQAARAEQALTQLNALQSRLVDQSESLPAAAQALEGALQLQSSLAAEAQNLDKTTALADQLVQIANGLNTIGGDDVAAASQRATDLLAMHDMLADAQNLRLSEAEANLQVLLTTQSQLLHVTPQIAAAAENLELLTAFQEELNGRLAGLEHVRRDLLEIALLHDTVARVVEAVGPIAELSDLRRLDSDQVRAIARELLDRRTAQAELTEPASVRSASASDPGGSPPTSGPVEIPVPAPMQP